MLTNPRGKVILQNEVGGINSISVANDIATLSRPNIVTRGLVNYWALEEDPGLSDFTGVKDTAFIYGVTSNPLNGWRTGTAPVSEDGILGRCHRFSGDDYVLFPQSGYPLAWQQTGTYSVEVWVKSNESVSSFGYALSLAGGGGTVKFIMALDGDPTTGTLYFQGGASGTWSPNKSATNYSPNAWNQLVMTYSNTSVKVYINGVYATAFSGTAASEGARFTLGANNSGSQNFKGFIDEVKFYNVELTPNEVLQNYQAYGSKIATKGLVSWWKLKDNAQDSAKMVSASGGVNPLTLYNGTYYLDNSLKLDGDYDYADTGNSSTLIASSQMSMEFWLKGSYVTTRYLMKYIVTDSFVVAFYDNSGSSFYCQGGGNESNYSLISGYNASGWNHIVLTCNNANGSGSKNKLYLNGINISTWGTTNMTGGSSGRLYLGSNSGSANFFNGNYKDVRMYNRELAAQEVQMNYSAGRSK